MPGMCRALGTGGLCWQQEWCHRDSTGVSLPLDVPSSCSWSHQGEGAPGTELPHPRKCTDCQERALLALPSSPMVPVGLEQPMPRADWHREGATWSPQEL